MFQPSKKPKLRVSDGFAPRKPTGASPLYHTKRVGWLKFNEGREIVNKCNLMWLKYAIMIHFVCSWAFISVFRLSVSEPTLRFISFKWISIARRAFPYHTASLKPNSFRESTLKTPPRASILAPPEALGRAPGPHAVSAMTPNVPKSSRQIDAQCTISIHPGSREQPFRKTTVKLSKQ